MRRLGTLIPALACVTLACGGTTTDGVYRTPIVERGVCATILMPGQTMPMPEPGETPGCKGGYSSIAGGGVVEDSQKTTKTEPHPAVKVLAAPFAVLLFPFKLLATGAQKLGEIGKKDEVPLDPRLRAQQARIAKVDPQTEHEQEQLSALERQLEQRGGKTRSSQSGPAVATGSASAAAPAPRRSSIADELAALRGRGTSANATAPEAPVESAALPPAPETAPVSDAAPPATPADRVLDSDGDGKADHWIYLSQGRPAREQFDDDGDGRPDRTLLLDPASGQPLRLEEDRNDDGKPDSISEYKGGQLARIRRDTNLDGVPDAWSYYRAGQLVREEQDPDGDGFRNRVVIYHEGHVAVEREDRDGDGRVDRITRYDAAERPLQRDEDQDGDGLVDARSFYEEGRLVRRELVSESQRDALEEEEDLSSAEWTTEPNEAHP